MDILLNYLFIGIIFMFIVDFINYRYKNHPTFKDIPELRWKERIFFVSLWPVMLLTFLKAFFKEFFK